MRIIPPENSVILITGANNGIGLSLTKALVNMPYRIACLDLSCENLKPLRETHADSLHFYHCDLTHDCDVREAVGRIISSWSRIDVLVNNACIAGYQLFEECSFESIRQQFEVNFFGYLRTIQAIIPIMKAQGGGIIHNVSSGVGLTGFPGASGYAASKGAIESLSRTLRLEMVRYNIWVTIVHPPLTYTRSSALLGIPASSMADPLVVGRKLAAHIFSTKAVIILDYQTALGLLFSRLFPAMMGRVLSLLTQRMGKSI